MSELNVFLSCFEEYGDRTALVFNEKEYSYAWLSNKITDWSTILAAKKIEKSVVAFRGDYSPEIVALFFALIHLENILVPLGGSNVGEQERYFDIANVQYVLSISNNGELLIEDLKSAVQNSLLAEFVQRQVSGVILFSSGSTGTPKGMLHDCEKLLSKYVKGRKVLTTLAFLALDHIGGINTLLYQLSNGGTTVTTDDRRPETICRLIEKYKIELLPVSPTFLNLLWLSR